MSPLGPFCLPLPAPGPAPTGSCRAGAASSSAVQVPDPTAIAEAHEEGTKPPAADRSTPVLSTPLGCRFIGLKHLGGFYMKTDSNSYVVCGFYDVSGISHIFLRISSAEDFT